MATDVPELEGDFVVTALLRDATLAPPWDDSEARRGATLRFVPRPGPELRDDQLRPGEGLALGSSGVNSVGGCYRQRGARLRLRGRTLSTTLVFHPDEPPLLDCLLRVRHVAVEGDAVHLLDADRAVVLVLRRA